MYLLIYLSDCFVTIVCLYIVYMYVYTYIYIYMYSIRTRIACTFRPVSAFPSVLHDDILTNGNGQSSCSV